MENKMLCFQCQETAGNKGCTQVGVCGKQPNTANLQDVLVYATQGLANLATQLRLEKIVVSPEINHRIVGNLFITITNANFDDEVIVKEICETMDLKKILLAQIEDDKSLFDAAKWMCYDIEDMRKKAMYVGVISSTSEDVTSLRALVINGLKGLAAYLRHAQTLQKEDEQLYNFLQTALTKTLDDALDVQALLELVMETGKFGVDAMALLDMANTSTYGNPEITSVKLGVGNRPGILISGHDLKDLELLLQQSEGSGIDIYTHSEMLPAHYYPAFKKYKHFIGNYGNAWWKQKEEFESFQGPILMTTNCLVPPKSSYIQRIYTTGSTGFPGCIHIEEKSDGTKDFSAIIAHAKTCTAPIELETGSIVGGFAHNQVIALADKIVEAVKSGAIKKFVVMAGCDGRMKSREYYTQFAQELPKDTVILTAGCAKYRYNKLNLGDIQGIPRVLDAGQCNDSYSLAIIALKLKEVFELNDINELPIIYNIAWYEQKAVIVLLALLHLGVKNIHLGPTLPAFLSPTVVNVLVNNFGIAGITSVEEDMKLFFN